MSIHSCRLTSPYKLLFAANAAERACASGKGFAPWCNLRRDSVSGSGSDSASGNSNGVVSTVIGEDGILGDTGVLFGEDGTLGRGGPLFGDESTLGKDGGVFGNDNN